MKYHTRNSIKRNLLFINSDTLSTMNTISTMYNEVVKGLGNPQKSLPSKFFYDKNGSELFESICEVEEYYLTRTELRIMEMNIQEISNLLGEQVQLIELGSGSSRKTRILLNNLEKLDSYVPVDISSKFLAETVEKLKAEYPALQIIPKVTDYTRPFNLPGTAQNTIKIVFFPGSTIGNFTIERARSFIRIIADVVGGDGGLLIGFDLKKDTRTLENAYNDSEGVTAAFNKNILLRLNRELGADFNPEYFEHRAFYNEMESRMEMHLVSLAEQKVRVNGAEFHFSKEESIHTENSHKYSIDEFRELSTPHFEPVKTWTDSDNKFCVQLLKKNRRK